MEMLIKLLAREFDRKEEHIKNVITLIDEGNTIPFIARYRKEMHGTMDDALLRDLSDRLQYLRNLQERRDEIKKSLENQEKLTEELSKKIDSAATLAELEDIYRPYKQKRRTRATIAKEKGLEPLALKILLQPTDLRDLTALAEEFVKPELGVPSAQEALQGASDILAEIVSDNADVRGALREYIFKHGTLSVSGDKEKDSVYRLYYDFHSPIAKLQGYQILAINRGEKEEFLKVTVEVDRASALRILQKAYVTSHSPASDFVSAACEDSYDRLITPSIERQIRTSLTENASESAIHTFALNLKPLLLQPPVKGHVTMGLDPGYRNGCKVAVVSAT